MLGNVLTEIAYASSTELWYTDKACSSKTFILNVGQGIFNLKIILINIHHQADISPDTKIAYLIICISYMKLLRCFI